MINSKSETLNTKQIKITEVQNSKRYDLEERTFSFAAKARDYVKGLPQTITNVEIGRQLFRAAGSVGANYIEANEALSRKDFTMRVKISRKESKECRYWLGLSEPTAANFQARQLLVQEATELMKIFGAILEKCR